MKPTEEKLDAIVREKFVEFASHHYGTKNFSRDMDYDGSYILPINNEWDAFEAGYDIGYAAREADAVEIIIGEPEIGDLAIDENNVIAEFSRFYSDKPQWVSVNYKYSFNKRNYTIIMRNGKVVLDKREL